jgi:hypothetical protein
MHRGYISLYRKLQDHWLFSEKRQLTYLEAWIVMLWEVNHKDGKMLIQKELIECKRGQSVNSIETWAKKFKWSPRQVGIFFEKLEKDGMIIKEGKAQRLSKTSRITICNYDGYQNPRQTDVEQKSNKHQKYEDDPLYKSLMKDVHRSTNNNVNNINNENNANKGGALSEKDIERYKRYRIAIGNALIEWFEIDKTKNSPELNEIRAFVDWLYKERKLNLFKTRFNYYMRYMWFLKDTKHKLNDFIGKDHKYEEGIWNSSNWKREYEEFKTRENRWIAYSYKGPLIR